MSANPTDSASTIVVERLLGLKRHEYVAVAWSFAYFFCILSSYYLLRPLRESMGVGSGVNTIPILFSTTFLVMLVVSPIFGWIASRYRRRQFLPWVYYFFVANILIFYLLFTDAVANETSPIWLGRVFFVWISVFNLFVVSVFWSFMADIYTREQGRRLFGFISAGGSIGAFVGPMITKDLVVEIGHQNLFPISAGLLLVGVVCIYRLRRWVDMDREHQHPDAESRGKPIGGSALAGIKHIAKSKYLASICAISVVASLLGTALYMFMAEFVGEAIAGTDERTALFARIDFYTGLITFLFQLLAVRHAVQKLGVGMTLALMPIMSMIGFLLLSMNPALVFVAVFQAARRSIGFGFTKPTTDMLYTVVTREEKYKAKNFIDTAVYRSGDLIGTWSVKLMWGLGVAGISIVMVPFAFLWAIIAFWLGRDYRRRAKRLKESGVT